MYRKIMLGQIFGLAPVTRDELRLLLGLTLQMLLDITGELLAWQVEHDMPIDLPYMQGAAPVAEYTDFLATLRQRPIIDQSYAERLLRPLASQCFDLRTFPDEALAQIFTLPRLQALFPLALRGESGARKMRAS